MLKHLMPVALLVSSAMGGGASPRETPQRLVLAGEILEVHIDRASGQLAEVVHRPSGVQLLDGRLSPLDIRADGRWAATSWRYAGHRLETVQKGKRLTVRSRAGDWEVAGHYELDGDLLARSATFRYLGTGKPTVRGTRFWLRGAAAGKPDDGFYEILSRWPPERFPMSKLSDGRRRQGTSSHTTSGFVGVHNGRRKLSLITAFYSESEWAHVWVREGKSAIDVAHDHRVLDRPKRGQPIPSGTQYLLAVEGDWEQALEACQGLYGRIGVVVPKAIAERGARSVIYSCHPGGTIDSGFRDVGHIRRLQTCLPRLEKLGINVVWMLPFWHGRVYAPVSYDRLQENWADEESLRAFTQDAHRRRMKVLLDLIPHGPRPESGLHERHRDWVSTTEDGKMLLWWGCLGCDYAHPGWQRFVASHAADWVRRCGIDGYRVDCAGGGPPNWAAADGRRPSQSGIWGAMGILRKARAEMEKVKSPVILLAEAEGVPLNTACEYTYPWTWFFSVLPAFRDMPPQEWVPKAARWLQNRKHTMPRGANAIWFLENHDTPRAEMVWGPKAQRALLALCAFARGAPFLYQEQQVGYTAFLRKLYAIRRSSDLFSIGEADYLPLADDPRVLTILRRHGDQAAVAAISFADDPLRTRIRLPAKLLKKAAGCVLHDLARPGTRFALDEPIELAPWAYAVLLVEHGKPARPRAPEKPPRKPGEPFPVKSTRGEELLVSNQHIELVADRRRGGTLQSLRYRGCPGNWLAGHDLAEGPRKLWPGRPAFRLSTRSLPAAEARMHGDGTAYVFKTTLGDDIDLEHAYVIDYRPQLTIRVWLTPRRDIVRTRAALTTTLRFPIADEWAVQTIDGVIADRHTLWRFDDVPHRARYWHATTNCYWESRLQPTRSGLHDPRIFLANTASNAYLGIGVHAWDHPDLLQNVVLKERDGDHKELTLRVEWLRGDRPVTLRKGQRYGLDINFLFGAGRPWEQPEKRHYLKARPSLRTSKGNFVVANDHYRIVLARSRGGNIRRLQLPGRDAPIISNSRIYTDYGLYDTYRDPLGREHRTFASNEGDFEQDVEIRHDAQKLRVAFTSYFRHHAYGNRSLLHPRCQYRLAYTFDRSPLIGVEAAVRPQMTLPQAKAFLAHTVRFAGARRWAVAGSDGGFAGPLGKAEGRLWQSASRPLRSPRLGFETPGGTAVIADVAPEGALKNLFLHAGGEATTAFFAWLDGQPADVSPHWRTVAYTLRVGLEGLDAALRDIKKLKPWPPAKQVGR